MVFCVDVGNTNVVLGCYRADSLVFQSRVSTDRLQMGDEYAVEFHSILALYQIDKADITGAVVSSVVPALTDPIARAVEVTTGIRPLLLGPNVTTGLQIRLDSPFELGSDLTAAAVAAKSRYPLPCVIIDMGTATTLTVLNESGVFLGGAIAPGVRISLDSLISRTSMLIGISLDAPKNVIGTNTADCMKSGLILGSAAMLDGLLDRISRQLQKEPFVVATGGLAAVVVPHCRWKIVADDRLLLDGLRIIYEMNSPESHHLGE